MAHYANITHLALRYSEKALLTSKRQVLSVIYEHEAVDAIGQ